MFPSVPLLDTNDRLCALAFVYRSRQSCKVAICKPGSDRATEHEGQPRTKLPQVAVAD